MPGAVRGGCSTGEREPGATGDSRARRGGTSLTRAQSRSVGGNQGQPRVQMARKARGDEAGHPSGSRSTCMAMAATQLQWSLSREQG